MVEVARLLDAGADPDITVASRPGESGLCSLLYAASGHARDELALPPMAVLYGGSQGRLCHYRVVFESHSKVGHL